jgi:hypothetical protein
MAQIQNCTITRPVNNKLANTLKIAVKEIDTLITSATKDLPIAKLYQLVKVGATIAYGLNNLKSGKLKTLLQTVIIKLLKIFNIYFFILKTKIIAATKYSSTSEEKKKNILGKIYKLDMTDVDNALDEFYELNNDNPPKSFFSKVNPDSIILKFESITEKLSSVINDALTRLSVLLIISNKYVTNLNFEDSEQFEIMNSPITSSNCNNMDFEKIFSEIVAKAKNLQSELLTNTKFLEDLTKETELTQKYLNRKSLEEELGCRPDQIVTFAPGFPPYCRDKSTEIKEAVDENNFDPTNLDEVLAKSGNALPPPVARATTTPSPPTPSPPTPVPTPVPTPASTTPEKKVLWVVFLDLQKQKVNT